MEGWGEKAYNCNWITIKIKKKKNRSRTARDEGRKVSWGSPCSSLRLHRAQTGLSDQLHLQIPLCSETRSCPELKEQRTSYFCSRGPYNLCIRTNCFYNNISVCCLTLHLEQQFSPPKSSLIPPHPSPSLLKGLQAQKTLDAGGQGVSGSPRDRKKGNGTREGHSGNSTVSSWEERERSEGLKFLLKYTDVYCIVLKLSCSILIFSEFFSKLVYQ